MKEGDRVRVKPGTPNIDLLPSPTGKVFAVRSIGGQLFIDIELDGGGYAMQRPADEWELEEP